MTNVQSAIAGFLKKDLTILIYKPNVLSYNLLNHLRLHFSSFKNKTHIAGVNIKDMNPEIYRSYTGADNGKVISNLRRLAEAGLADRCVIRIPLIPEFNTDKDRENSVRQLQEMGFTRFDRFDYIIKNNR